MQVRQWFLISLIVLLCLIIVGGVINANASSYSSRGAAQITQVKPHPKIGPPGYDAIMPRNNSPIAITADDVRQFTQKSGFAGGPTLTGKPPVITMLKFMTSKQARALTGDELGLPDSAMVCYVVLRGPFNPIGVSGPPGTYVPSSIMDGYEIFDAHTGRLIVWGF